MPPNSNRSLLNTHEVLTTHDVGVKLKWLKRNKPVWGMCLLNSPTPAVYKHDPQSHGGFPVPVSSKDCEAF